MTLPNMKSWGVFLTIVPLPGRPESSLSLPGRVFLLGLGGGEEDEEEDDVADLLMIFATD